jgi:putative ABC transport system permease protein
MRAVGDLQSDIQYGFRALRNSPGFTVIAVGMLSVAIGINVAVFTVASAALFRGFRVIAGNDRLLYIGTQKDGRGCCVSYPDFEDWRAQSTSFAGLGAVADLQISFIDSTGAPEHYDATLVTSNAFRLLGQTPILGRDFASADEQPGAPPVAILTSALWERRYGRNPDIIGRAVRINGMPTTVIGVMPPDFSFPQNQDLWLPLVRTPERLERSARTLWFAFGRLADGARFEGARAELAAIGRRLAIAYPTTNEGWIPSPRTFAQFFVGVDAAVIYGALWGAVGLVLLIACANLGNLLLARAIRQSREIAVRMALGAARWRIVRQLLVENLMLASAAGVAGWWVARWIVGGYAAMANPPTRAWSEHLLDYRLNADVFLYTVGISALVTVLVGVAPALRLGRLDIAAALKDAARGVSGGKRGKRLSAGLLIGQLALTMVLLTAAGVMARSFLNLTKRTANLGIDTRRILMGMVSLPADRYSTVAQRAAFFDRVRQRVGAIPGVESVSLAGEPPASGAASSAYEIAGTPAVDPTRRPTVSAVTIAPGYFRTVGARVLSGREFAEADAAPGARATIVNQTFAAQQWPGTDPIGQQLRLFGGGGTTDWLTVVGVVSDVVQNITRQSDDPVAYVPFRQQPRDSMWVLVRALVPPASLSGPFRREIQGVDPDVPVWLGPFPLEERLAGSGIYWSVRNNALLLATFSIVALGIASVGLHAVVAYSVDQRRQEIGIRMAIGATTHQVVGLVFREGMRPVAVGLIAGLVGSAAVNRLLASELVQISTADPLVLAAATAVLVVSAGVGCAIPAARAMRVDPVVALRSE